jgi:hypothetical protein
MRSTMRRDGRAEVQIPDPRGLLAIRCSHEI